VKSYFSEEFHFENTKVVDLYVILFLEESR